jgi:hypothetical protein
MRLLRNAPMLMWWLACIAALIKFPVAICMIGLIFLVAMPMKKTFLPDVPDTDEHEIQPLLGVCKYSALQQMTAISVIKAYVYANRVKGGAKSKPPTTKMLDIAPAQGE